MKRWFNSTFPTFTTFPTFSAFLARVTEGYGFAIVLSLVLHVITFGVFAVNWNLNTDARMKIAPPMPINAALVQLPEPAAKPQTLRKPGPSQTEKKREIEAKRQAEAKRKEALRRKAEQQKKEQERQKALALKREQEKKQKEQEALRQEELRKKEAAAAWARQEQQRRAQEQARERALAMELQALREAQQLEHEQLEQAKYAALIESLVAQYWNRPPSARNNMVAEVRITLSPLGDVLEITLTKPSGNDEFDRSVTQAIRRASPFAELKNLEQRIFDQYFRKFTFRFRPEDLVR